MSIIAQKTDSSSTSRKFTKTQAEGYGLTGWVRNTDNGKVWHYDGASCPRADVFHLTSE